MAKRRVSEQIVLDATKNDRGAHPKIGRDSTCGKHLRPTDIWFVPVMRKAILEGFFDEFILFLGSVDLNRVLNSTKSPNCYSCYRIQYI